MFFPFRGDRIDAGTNRTLYAGACINSDCNRIETALIGIHGCEVGSPVYLHKCSSFDLPREVVDLFETTREQVMDDTFQSQWTVKGTNSGKTKGQKKRNDNIQIETSFKAEPNSYSSLVLPVSLNTLREKLTDAMEEALDDLTMDTVMARIKIRLATIQGPDFSWFGGSVAEILDIGRIARRTGMTIFSSLRQYKGESDLYEKDGPLPYWVYLSHRDKNSVLIDLGKRVRIIRLPRDKGNNCLEQLEQIETIPCGLLLDPLVYKASRGSASMDRGGRLSVLGRNIPEVVSTWNGLQGQTLTDFLQKKFPNEINKLTISCLNALSHQEGLERWSDYDILCSAVHWIAERTAALVGDFTEELSPNAIYVTGGGRLNALLYTCLMKEFLPSEEQDSKDNGKIIQLHHITAPIKTVDELGIPGDSFEAMISAMAGLLFDTGIFDNSFSISGQITPGSREHWNHFRRTSLL